jgi:beta-lactamase class D
VSGLVFSHDRIHHMSHFLSHSAQHRLPLRLQPLYIMRNVLLASCALILFLGSCSQTRIHEHASWGQYFDAYGVKNGCFILRDNNHEAVHYYNLPGCTTRLLPASTFKIFNSLVALETDVAPDDQFIIPWDSVKRGHGWDRDMNMRDAFRLSNVAYYQEIARRIGRQRMQHYLDTVKYGNMDMGGAIDTFWLNDSLQISADEQAGFIKKLYFNELPFSERTQRIVRSMMLHDEAPQYKLYYKTGWGILPNKQILWVVGFAERIEDVNEPKESMNKSNERAYPYFFAENFEVPVGDTTKDWASIRIAIAHQILADFGAIPKSAANISK